jgi:hypothetical protein
LLTTILKRFAPVSPLAKAVVILKRRPVVPVRTPVTLLATSITALLVARIIALSALTVVRLPRLTPPVATVGLTPPLDLLVTSNVFSLIHKLTSLRLAKQKGGHLAALALPAMSVPDLNSSRTRALAARREAT